MDRKHIYDETVNRGDLDFVSRLHPLGTASAPDLAPESNLTIRPAVGHGSAAPADQRFEAHHRWDPAPLKEEVQLQRFPQSQGDESEVLPRSLEECEGQDCSDDQAHDA
jgi:hypothetical protein